MNFDNPERMPKICYILEHEWIKNNTIVSVINIIDEVITRRLAEYPLHNVEDLLYCIDKIKELEDGRN